MAADNCPEHDMLRSYLSGSLASPEAEIVRKHVGNCAQCQTQLLSLSQNRDEPPAEPAAPVNLTMVASDERGATLPAMSATEIPFLGQLGEYRVLEKLGEGGMGTVYKALHVELDRMVAIKVLPKASMSDETAILRFQREIKTVAQLDHPNIVRAYDAREIEGTRFLVMEYVLGIDLSELVGRVGPLPVADACEIVRQAALGLEEAHERGLVHRDVKPSNVILSDRCHGQAVGFGAGTCCRRPRPTRRAAYRCRPGHGYPRLHRSRASARQPERRYPRRHLWPGLHAVQSS